MLKVEHTIEIARGAVDVFAYLTDVENLPRWQESVQHVRAEGPLAEGTRIHDVREFLGRRATSTLEVSRHDPPRQFSLRVVEGPIRYEIDHVLADLDGRTRLAVTARADVPGLFGFAARPMVKAVERQLRADLERLRGALERP